MSNLFRHKGYFGTVQYSEEDDLLYGKVAGIKDLIIYDGNSLPELKQEFIESVEHYLEVCAANNFEPDNTSMDKLKNEISENAQEIINNHVAM